MRAPARMVGFHCGKCPCWSELRRNCTHGKNWNVASDTLGFWAWNPPASWLYGCTAVIRPSLSGQREMHVVDDAPLLSAVASASDVRAHRESVSEFRMIGISWAGNEKHDIRVRTVHAGTWSAWTTVGATDSGPDPRTREARQTPARTASEPLWVGQADGYQIDVPSGLTA